jgi:hypothetical protein
LVLDVRRMPAFAQAASSGRVWAREGATFAGCVEVKPVSDVIRAVMVPFPVSGCPRT